MGITLTTKDDLIPEPSTMFILQLTNSNGGSRIEPVASSASITGDNTLSCVNFAVCDLLLSSHSAEE